MNKVEFKRRLEEVEELLAQGKYSAVVKRCDELSIEQITDPRMLQGIAKAYEKCRRYVDAEDVLHHARSVAPKSRSILFHLCNVATKAGDLEEAKEFYQDFAKLAPHDSERFVLQYRIGVALDQPPRVLIEILENMKEEEADDHWMYVLAQLYAKIGKRKKAVEICDEIGLWFNSGRYVKLAAEMKEQLEDYMSNPVTYTQTGVANREDAFKPVEDAETTGEEIPTEEIPTEEIPTEKIIVEENSEEESPEVNTPEAPDADASWAHDLNWDFEDDTAEPKNLSEGEGANLTGSEVFDRYGNTAMLQPRSLEAVAKEFKKESRKDSEAGGPDLRPRTEETNESSAFDDTMPDVVPEFEDDVPEADVPEFEEELDEADVSEAEESGAPVIEELTERDLVPEKAEAEPDEFLTGRVPLVIYDDEEETDEPSFEGASEEAETVKPVYEDAVVMRRPVIDNSDLAGHFRALFDSEDDEPVTTIQAEKNEPEEPVEDYEKTAELNHVVVTVSSAESLVGALKAEKISKTEIPERPSENMEEDSYRTGSFTKDELPRVDYDPGEVEKPDYILDKDSSSFLEKIAKKKDEETLFENLPVDPEVTGRTWHFIVYGETELALECALDKLSEIGRVNRNCPKKVLKISAGKIGNASIVNSLDRFLGNTVIVENAGSLSDSQLEDFSKVLDRDDRSLLIVFTDTKRKISALLQRVPALAESFTAVFEGREYTPRDLVRMVADHLFTQEAKMTEETEMYVLGLAKDILLDKRGGYVQQMRELSERALDKAEKGGFLGIGSGRMDKENFLVVDERHFKKAMKEIEESGGFAVNDSLPG